MTFLGVPIFDWVLLLVVLGFGVEAWITCRDTGEDKKTDASDTAPQAPDTGGQTRASVGEHRPDD